MPCICCLSEDCDYWFQCEFKHEASCKDCLPTFLLNSMKQLFAEKKPTCMFCLQRIGSSPCSYRNKLTLADFGLMSTVADDADAEHIESSFRFAECHYAFDILVNIVYLKKRFDMSEICNALIFYKGFEGITAVATCGVRNRIMMKDVTSIERSLILIAICLITLNIERVTVGNNDDDDEVVVPSTTIATPPPTIATPPIIAPPPTVATPPATICPYNLRSKRRREF